MRKKLGLSIVIQATELLYRLYKKYYSLLLGKAENYYIPNIKTAKTGWERVFEQAWIIESK